MTDDVEMLGDVAEGSAGVPGPPGVPTAGIPVDLASRLFPPGAGVETPIPEEPPGSD